MARTFSGTDRIQATGMLAIDTGSWSTWAWVYVPTGASSGANQAIVLGTNASTINIQILRLDATNLKPRITQLFSTTNSATMASAALANDTWTLLVGTYDDSDKKGRLYSGTSAAAMTQLTDNGETAGVGTRTTGGNECEVGNRHDGGTPFTVGRIARAGICANLLTLNQMDALRLGADPRQIGLSDVRAFFLLEGDDVRDASPYQLGVTVIGTACTGDPPGATLQRRGRVTTPWRATPGVLFDAASSSSIAIAGTTLSWSHTVGSQNNRLLLVGVSLANTLSQTVSSVTYGSQSLILVGTRNNGTSERVEMWSLVAPTSGTATITVTFSAAAVAVGGASSLYEVRQTTPVDGFVSTTGTGTSASVTVTVASALDLVHDVVASAAASLTAGAGQTQRWNIGVAGVAGAGSTEYGGNGTVVMTWTASVSAAWTQAGLDVHYAGGAAAPPPSTRKLLAMTGVG